MRPWSCDSVSDALVLRAVPQPAFEGRAGVAAEVVPVALVNRLQQEAGLDVVELGRRAGHLYSHTLISESSWSTSTGFVM